MEAETITDATTAPLAQTPDVFDPAVEGEAAVGLALTPDALLATIQQRLADGKAEDILTIDLADKSTMADAMVIASGRSSRQVISLAEDLREKLKAAGVKGIATEGETRGDWVLVDAGDVIVHLFRPEVRSFYNLEKMWAAPLPDDGDFSGTGADAAADAGALSGTGANGTPVDT